MSCNSCPCHFKWPLDNVGTRRDPINCEKAWLDFAVRLLSREAVGKGRGQETVWSEKCKPSWWDRKVRHAWKNPTANPKDTKEVLLEKFVALESQLREEKRFPSELEEESRLWSEGKYRELFLMTSLTSLLGKVTSVHSAIEDACGKVKELKATVHQSILANIQNCLTASLKSTEQLTCANSKSCSRDTTNTKAATKKRNFESLDLHKENIECPPAKQRKLEPTYPSCKQNLANCLVHLDDRQPTTILQFAQKLLAKRKSNPQKSSENKGSRNMNSSKFQREILPKTVPQLVVPQAGVAQLNTTCSQSLQGSSTVAPAAVAFVPATAPVCTVTVTPEEPGYFLSPKTLTPLTGASHTLGTSNIPSDLGIESFPNDCYLDVSETSPQASPAAQESAFTVRTNPHLLKPESPSASSEPTETSSPSCASLSQVSTTPGYVGEFCDKILQSKSHAGPESSSSAESCVTSSPEIDLDFLVNDLNLDELCSELFKESSSPHTAVPFASPSNTESGSQMKPQNYTSLHTLCENKIEENSSLTGSETLLEATHFTGSETVLEIGSQTRCSSSSPDIGYCSDSSPFSSSASDPMQEAADLDPAFLLDKFLSYAENPFSQDLL
ncbi:hypothetical protein ElyMa_001984100 [Elysia marginata]|uniref:Nuclear apoptosis-inducing factor 1 n=1 Tax=Elysia marginata TaxID=1093978 RepID=A0AAV4F1U8_9GAST|nr:hypothetical protein ElyMa_001984100 [Elysia marginata]